MRFTAGKAAAAATLALAIHGPAAAGTLEVQPVLVDVTAPGAASTVTLRNEGATAITAQIRVFRWSLVDGQEKLEPTNDVVASPPSVSLTPKGQYVTRVVRVSKQPIAGEESYRLLIDQLPDRSQQKSGSVNLLMRYSIPVFFGTHNRKNPAVTWSLAMTGDKMTLTARNSGERRLRISQLTLRDSNGHSVSFGTGLAGYALGQSAKSWTVQARGFALGKPAAVSAQSDGGPIQAVASVATR